MSVLSGPGFDSLQLHFLKSHLTFVGWLFVKVSLLKSCEIKPKRDIHEHQFQRNPKFKFILF